MSKEIELKLFWERCTTRAFPRDTNLFVGFDGKKQAKLIGWVRELVHPDTAGFYAHRASSLFYFFPPGSVDSDRRYPTKAQAMRALRSATLVAWIAASPERREFFIRQRGKI